MQNETALPVRISLEVYRRLDNRFEGLPDHSPRGFELHIRRKKALHDVLDAKQDIQVLDWGLTDDAESHELVELGLASAVGAAFQYAVVPGLKFLGQKLAEKLVDNTTSEMAKAIVAWLRPKQESKEILDFTIMLPDKTTIHVDPPDRDATIRINFSNGKFESVTYTNLTS